MPKFVTALLTVALMVCATSTAQAAGPVWKVSDADTTLYLGGTIHMLSASDYPLPETFDQAYSHAGRVVFETDLLRLQEPEFQRQMLEKSMFSDGSNLKQVVDSSTFALLEQHFESRGLPAKQWLQLKPGMLATTLTMMELRRLGLLASGVDLHYSERAEAENKARGQLESALSQIEAISNMAKGHEDDFLRHTLQEIDSLPAMLQSLRQAWREGDTEQLNSVVVQPMQSEFPSIYKSLLVERNRAWLPQLVDMMASEEVELVLVGAAHLVGEQGLLAKLDQLGYSVEQL